MKTYENLWKNSIVPVLQHLLWTNITFPRVDSITFIVQLFEANLAVSFLSQSDRLFPRYATVFPNPTEKKNSTYYTTRHPNLWKERFLHHRIRHWIWHLSTHFHHNPYRLNTSCLLRVPVRFNGTVPFSGRRGSNETGPPSFCSSSPKEQDSISL